MKQSKKLYYTNYFKNKIKYMRKTWKRIKSIISQKAKESESPNLNNKGEVLTNPIDIVSNFDNFFFCFVAPHIKSNVKPTFKAFHHYLTNSCEE